MKIEETAVLVIRIAVLVIRIAVLVIRIAIPDTGFAIPDIGIAVHDCPEHAAWRRGCNQIYSGRKIRFSVSANSPSGSRPYSSRRYATRRCAAPTKCSRTMDEHWQALTEKAAEVFGVHSTPFAPASAS
jgi:hypothetical protein